MATGTLTSFFNQPQHGNDNNNHMDDRLDAARALLGVSPSSVAEGDGPLSLLAFGGRNMNKPDVTFASTPAPPPEVTSEPVIQRRPRSNSAGLDALAFLAEKEHASMGSQQDGTNSMLTNRDFSTSAPPQVSGGAAGTISTSCSSSEDEDFEAMPPPPPRMGGRRRSVSNPEGMEKWAPRQNRLRFVLPAAILEEELAEANAALQARQEQAMPLESSRSSSFVEVENKENDTDDGDIAESSSSLKEEKDEADMDQDELLRRARSRLLEDLSEGSLNGEKGVLTLPHALDKYKEVYNQGGRIGIYTPAERAAIINRFNGKRERRVWNKKIRYNCRKNLADRRMRVKGRFVKRGTESVAVGPSIPESEEAKYVTPDPSEKGDDTSVVVKEDEDMPDVNDPEAGFCPTDDQPYRRCRRHTIT